MSSVNSESTYGLSISHFFRQFQSLKQEMISFNLKSKLSMLGPNQSDINLFFVFLCSFFRWVPHLITDMAQISEIP